MHLVKQMNLVITLSESVYTDTEFVSMPGLMILYPDNIF